MPTVKNNGKLKHLHVGLRTAIAAISEQYEKANGTLNSKDKLFIAVSPADDAQYLAAVRSKDEKQRAEGLKGIKSVAIAYVENGKKDFAHPYLMPYILAVVGNKAKRVFANLEFADGCLVIDGGKPFKPAKEQDEAPAPEADKEEPQDEAPAKKSRKSKKDENEADA